MPKRKNKAQRVNRKLKKISDAEKLRKKNFQTKERILGNLEALEELDANGDINLIR